MRIFRVACQCCELTAAPGDMCGEPFSCEGTVSGGDRFDDGLVFTGVGKPPPGRNPVVEHTRGDGEERSEDQEVVGDVPNRSGAGVAADRPVEVEIGCIEFARGQGASPAGTAFAQFRKKFGRGAVACDPFCGDAFERFADFINFAELLDGRLPQDASGVDAGGRQTVLFQSDQRFPHRGPGDVVTGGEGFRRQFVAGDEPSFPDVIQDPQPDQVGGPAPFSFDRQFHLRSFPVSGREYHSVGIGKIKRGFVFAGRIFHESGPDRNHFSEFRIFPDSGGSRLVFPVILCYC